LLKAPNKALHRTAITLCSIAAGELVRSEQKAGIMTIQDLVAMGSGMEPVISPTKAKISYCQIFEILKTCRKENRVSRNGFTLVLF
jgi:hypothetical protein